MANLSSLSIDGYGLSIDFFFLLKRSENSSSSYSSLLYVSIIGSYLWRAELFLVVPTLVPDYKTVFFPVNVLDAGFAN